MEFGKGSGEECGGFEEADGGGGREAQCGGGPDAGNHGGAAHQRAAAGDGQEIVPFQRRGELRRGGLRVPALEPAKVRQHQRALDFNGPQEHVVDARLGIAVRVEHRVVC